LFDSDGDGLLTPEEAKAYNDAVDAWSDDAIQDGQDLWRVIDRQNSPLHSYEAYARTVAWKRRPFHQWVLGRTASGMPMTAKVVAFVIGAFLFAVARGVVMSLLFGDLGCPTPWTSC
jgi:hypothetical protein